jgi:hypothetical protein
VLAADVLGDGTGGEQVAAVLRADGEGLQPLAAGAEVVGGDRGDQRRIQPSGQEDADVDVASGESGPG